MKHTALPWKISSDGLGLCAYLPGNTEEDITTDQHYYVPLLEMSYKAWQDNKATWLISKEEYIANAEFIVTACNCHEKLTKLCKELADFLYGVSESVDLVSNKTYPLFKEKYSKAYSILAELEK